MENMANQGSTRRVFLRRAGAAAGAVGIASVAAQTGIARAQESDGAQAEDTVDIADANGLVPDVSTDPTYIPHLGELPTPIMEAPEKTEYSCDVLVVGGGLAGLNAAFNATQQGMNVVLVDKGYPGYSGLSPWARCQAFHDPDRDADDDLWERYMLLSCHNFANLTWEDVWKEESKETFYRLKDWGYFAQYPRCYDTDYWVDGFFEHDDGKGYFKNIVGENDRHTMYQRVLDENSVTTVPQTMILDIVQDDEGKVVGAVGIHYKSNTAIRFTAKATILCTGNGVIKSTGYPVGSDTYDGVYMGYQHGLPITGMEFEDFHSSIAVAPDSVYAENYYHYLENAWPVGGTLTEETIVKKKGVDGRWTSFLNGRGENDITKISSPEGTGWSVAFENGDTEDPRQGKFTSPCLSDSVPSGAIGMSTHLCAGVWCGKEDTQGYTGIPGLWVAGDGTNGCYVGGPNYGCMNGSTTNFVSIQGYRAGAAAAEYAGSIETVELPTEKVDAMVEEALAPLSVEKGYDPSWVRDSLYNIMAPGWVTLCKTEESLSNALYQVERLHDLVRGKIRAANGHALRLAHEDEHLLLAMELKLRAGLERKESRGYHYRVDYPFHDDNYLYYITQTKGEDGTPVVGRAEMEERWKGDLSASYVERYPGLNTPEEWAMYGGDEEKK